MLTCSCLSACCVCVRFCSSPLFTFVALNFPSFSITLYITAIHDVQPATSRTIEYRIPYKRCAVLRSNHQFLVHPPVFNTSYLIFSFENPHKPKLKLKMFKLVSIRVKCLCTLKVTENVHYQLN